MAGPNAFATYANNLAGGDPYYGSGLQNVLSDYVLGSYVDYKNMFRASAQLRFNEKDMSLDDQSLFPSVEAWLPASWCLL